MLIQLSESIVTCRQDTGSALDSMASPSTAAQPSQYPGSFNQTGRPASSTLQPPASAHSQPAGPQSTLSMGNLVQQPAVTPRRSQGKDIPARQSSADRRPASQWPPSGRSSPAEGLGQLSARCGGQWWSTRPQGQAVTETSCRERGGAPPSRRSAVRMPPCPSWRSQRVPAGWPSIRWCCCSSWLMHQHHQLDAISCVTAWLCSEPPALCGPLYEPPICANGQWDVANGRNSRPKVA